ncbi:MAG: iron complex outermembrane receptor protein [Paraglaciecola sp.]
MSLDYQGAYDDADSYQDGNGDKVLHTLYPAQNHVLTAAIRDEKQQLVVKLTHQSIGFQGFPNQYMDMTDNNSYGLTAQYLRPLEPGEYKGQVNWRNVKHEMLFFSAGELPSDIASL